LRVESKTTEPAPRRQLHLLYHKLRGEPAAYSYVTSTALFQQHLDICLQARQAEGSRLWPEITFDDGHLSNHDLAAPALESRHMTAQFFITAGWTGAKPGYMGWPELRALHASGHRIGAHGWSHTLLTHCNHRELEMELVRPRLVLEDKLGGAITTMSLPGGRANARVLAACRKAGYSRVFTSIPKAQAEPLGEIIGRLNVLGEVQPEWLAKVLDPASGMLAALERRQHIKDLAKSLLGDRLYGRVWSMVNRHEPEDTAA